MAIRIGKVELTGTQTLRTQDQRNLVEQRLPGGVAGVLQDLGRKTTRVLIEGIVWGEKSLDQLAKIRGMQVKARPVAFVADIVTATPVREVLLESVEVRQQAGFPNRYQYRIVARENAAKEAAGKGAAKKSAAKKGAKGKGKGASKSAAKNAAKPTAEADKKSFSKDAVENVNQSVSSQADAWAGKTAANCLTTNPDAIAQMSAEQSGAALAALAAADPEKAAGVMAGLAESGKLGGMVEEFADKGLNLSEQMGEVANIAGLSEMVGGVSDCMEYVQKAKQAANRFGALQESLRAFTTQIAAAL